MGEGNDLLKENKVQFVKVSSDSFVDFYLTDYFSVRDYSILQSLNIRLVLNCDAANSYNYFMNDIDYSWHYLEKIAMKL